MRFIQHFSFGRRTPKLYVRKKVKARASTIVIETDDKKNYAGVLNDFLSGKSSTLKIICGVAVVHPDDEFCRKVGIAIATDKSHFKARTFKIVKLEAGDTAVIAAGTDLAGPARVVVLTIESIAGPKIAANLVLDSVSLTVNRIFVQLVREDDEAGGCGCGKHCDN